MRRGDKGGILLVAMDWESLTNDALTVDALHQVLKAKGRRVDFIVARSYERNVWLR